MGGSAFGPGGLGLDGLAIGSVCHGKICFASTHGLIIWIESGLLYEFRNASIVGAEVSVAGHVATVLKRKKKKRKIPRPQKGATPPPIAGPLQ